MTESKHQLTGIWISAIILLFASSNFASDFITIRNGTFYKGCAKHYLVSMNYWSAMNLAADESAGGNQSRFRTEVRQLAEHGVNNVRIMAASEASQRGIEPYRMYPALQESPGVYNEPIFVGLDRAVAEFGKYNMTVVMTLHNFWQWSGGFPQYVSWATNNSRPLYPTSWDPFLNPPYGDWSKNETEFGSYNESTGTWSGFLGYAGRFYNDSSISNLTQTWYLNHIHKVVNRVNTITGVVYKDDPTIMTWELVNEPQSPPLRWIADTSVYIKSIAPKQLVTVGAEGNKGEWWFKRMHAPDAVDYACGHLWVQNWGYYDPLDRTNESLINAEKFADNFLRDLNGWATDLKKPLILEEFGMARDNWQNVDRGAPNASYLWNASATTTHRDRYLLRVISTVVDYFKQGKSFQGTGPWSYAGIYRPSDPRNSFGEAWAGDPPPEPPGMYDLYDTDNAMDIVAEQAKNVSEFLAEVNRGCNNQTDPENNTV